MKPKGKVVKTDSLDLHSEKHKTIFQKNDSPPLKIMPRKGIWQKDAWLRHVPRSVAKCFANNNWQLCVARACGAEILIQCTRCRIGSIPLLHARTTSLLLVFSTISTTSACVKPKTHHHTVTKSPSSHLLLSLLLAQRLLKICWKDWITCNVVSTINKTNFA